MDKALGIATVIFVGMPIVIMSLLISWVMDDERDDKGIPDANNSDGVCGNGRDRMGRGMDRDNQKGGTK